MRTRVVRVAAQGDTDHAARTVIAGPPRWQWVCVINALRLEGRSHHRWSRLDLNQRLSLFDQMLVMAALLDALSGGSYAVTEASNTHRREIKEAANDECCVGLCVASS